MRVGLAVNPFAGLGGPAGLKGSDATNTVELANARGVQSNIAARLKPFLEMLEELNIEVETGPADLGGAWCAALGVPFKQVSLDVPIDAKATTAEHTRLLVRELQKSKPDLIVFAGGDGTARDVLDALDENQAALGIPCGVKMHSGVFANNPEAAAEVVRLMSQGELVTVDQAEVRDIDEQAIQQGIVQSTYYGEMWVPQTIRYMQQVKSGGVEVEALVVNEIAADVIEGMDPETTYLIGSGSTTAAIMKQLDLPNTLLGVDVVSNGEVILTDAFESQLFDMVSARSCKLVITVIGGQGHLFGRGNQQLSARVIRAIGLDNIIVVATKSKLEALSDGILVDTGDAELDKHLCGFIRVVTGYEDAVLCPVRA